MVEKVCSSGRGSGGGGVVPAAALPQGVRDILPEEAARISLVESTILSVFERYSFERVITPIVEYLDSLALGSGEDLRARALKFIEPVTGRVVAIRPDITPQIARLAATRMRDCPLPLKLCYNESVLRCLDQPERKMREVLQVGAEYVTDRPSAEVDAEMIVVAVEALRALGLEDFKIDIGDVGFVRAVLDGLAVDDDERAKLRGALARKDSTGLAALVSGLDGVSAGERELLVALATFYGEEEVIEKALPYCDDEATRTPLENLGRMMEIVDEKGVKDWVTIDLGEVRGFDYYTGTIFEGFACGIGKPILSGGRYDDLLARYGYPCASTGLAFDVEQVACAMERDR
ncbi:MAG TPA: ATP phosphoribosyltransferase regulatory subunit [Deltaproteobacteria bacterium]|nr:ATP phosphoribosyltransferase regulatory subunit [Deltaproteobacteria bacterium]